VKAPARSGIAFAIVIGFLLAQVAWWMVFQFRESDRFERAARAFAAGDRAAAAAALGVDEEGNLDDRFHRQRFMFATEGVFLGVCAMIGVAFFYATLLRERRVMGERDRFLAGATHEFKTPLASIRLGLESLLDARVSEEKRREYLIAMVREADRLERSITNLLAASELRVRQGLVLTRGNLVGDLADLLHEFEPRFEAAGIALETSIADRAVVARDPAAIRIIVHNLLDNSLRYGQPGGRVEFRLDLDAGSAVIRVADDGIGIRGDDLERLFEPFFRGADVEHRGGSGLGLHLVREFVRMHGGSVAVRSDGPGKGSEFTVRLPLVEETA
jgi:signal transduction histidine kinase